MILIRSEPEGEVGEFQEFGNKKFERRLAFLPHTFTTRVSRPTWTLDVLFNGLPDGSPRLLFKGGTSLSKAYGRLSKFSEDIDITVFRADLGHAASMKEIEALSRKKREVSLDAIKSACREYIQQRS